MACLDYSRFQALVDEQENTLGEEERKSSVSRPMVTTVLEPGRCGDMLRAEDTADENFFSPSVVQRLRKLKMSRDCIWQVANKRLDVWAAAQFKKTRKKRTESGRAVACRPFCTLVVGIYPAGRMISRSLCQPPQNPAHPQEIAQALMRAMMQPEDGFAQSRPGKIACVTKALAGALYNTMKSIDVEVCVCSETPGIELLVKSLSSLLIKKKIATVSKYNNHGGVCSNTPKGLLTLLYTEVATFVESKIWHHHPPKKSLRLDFLRDSRALPVRQIWCTPIPPHPQNAQNGEGGGIAVYFSRLDMEARLDGSSGIIQNSLPACSFTGKKEADLPKNRRLKRTKPRLYDIRSGLELMYVDAAAQRAHWPEVKRFAKKLDQRNKDLVEKRQWWMSYDLSLLLVNKTRVPFNDLRYIESHGLPVHGSDFAAMHRLANFPFFVRASKGRTELATEVKDLRCFLAALIAFRSLADAEREAVKRTKRLHGDSTFSKDIPIGSELSALAPGASILQVSFENLNLR